MWAASISGTVLRYGTPGKIDEIKAVCNKHGALIVEDAAESFGATYKGRQTGMFGGCCAACKAQQCCALQ